MSAVTGFLSALFWGVIVLSALVFVHEAGHYLAARAFGMRVTEFFLGMPCRLRLSHVSASRGTEVGVTPLLLGGYTRICGMDGTASERAAGLAEELSARGRARVEDLACAVGCSPDEAMDDLVVLCDWATFEPYYDPELGEDATQGDWPRAFQTVRRDAQLRCAFDAGHDFSAPGSTLAGEPHALPAGGGAFVEAERGRTYQGKGFLARVVTLLAGPLVNIVLGLAIICATVSVGGVTVTSTSAEVGSVDQGGAAAAAGLEPGDVIVEVAGEGVSSWGDLQQLLPSKLGAGEVFSVTYTRDGVTQSCEVDPKDANGTGLVGIGPVTFTYHPTLAQSLGVAWGYVTSTADYVLKLIQPAHTAQIVSQSSSVVGISVAASQAASAGVGPLLSFAALVSLSLGFMNLLPIPPLDGGKVLIEVAQLIARRRISQRVQNWLSYAGLGLTLALFVIVLGHDLIRIVTGG